MNVEVVVVALSAVVALGSAALTSRATRQQTVLTAELDRQTAERARAVERQDVMGRFRDPLLWAAFDLQSRLFNIVRQGFLHYRRVGGTARERQYALRSTLFVLAEYLGWVEILRRRIQFLDLGSRQDNQKLVELLAKIGTALSTDLYSDRYFRVWRSEQRAIGEIMINGGGEADSCIGYAEFCRRLEADQEFAVWLSDLTEDVEALAERAKPHPRLVELQNALMDLIDFLDPEIERFPDRHRHRLQPSGLAGEAVLG
ncbi:hypothetical protein AB0C51_19285 [Streptomyces pathocidini]|uniref:hypothetical protein n=1 Tax=Streptomyces pathocidini TaxID=1650571 RepID=UPI00340AD935